MQKPTELYINGVLYVAPAGVVMRVQELEKFLIQIQRAVIDVSALLK